MPQVPINYLAVIIAAISSVVIGGVWYGPIFGKHWLKLAGITKEQMEQGTKKSTMIRSYLLMALGSLIMSYVLAHAIIFASSYLKITGISAGLMGGLWNWLGFIAPVTLGSVLWEGKSWKLWLLNNGYNLLSLLVMGIILAVWQ